MTERWRKRLGDLDKASPGDEVYERAKGGPRLPEEAIERPSASSRIVTGVAAFLIFALAIAVFAIPALRLRSGAGGSPGMGLQPLWPFQTLEEVEEYERDPVPLGSMGSGAFLDPRETAWAFGYEVTGWADGDFEVVETTPLEACTSWPATMPPVGTMPPTVAAGGGTMSECIYGPAEFPSSAALVPLGTDPATSPSSGSSPSARFRTFWLIPACSPGTDCRPGGGQVTVYQPLGSSADNAWAVVEATSDTAELAIQPGEVLRAGSVVSGNALLPSGARPILGVQIGAGDCDIGTSETPYATALGGAQRGGDVPAGLRIVLDLPARPSGCDPVEPGHVFIAVVEASTDARDPLIVRREEPLLAIAAVPVVVEWPDAPPRPTGSSVGPPTAIETREPVAWTSYTDQLGWTIDVPTSWTAEPFEEFTGRQTMMGARFFTGSLDPGGGPAPDEVLVTISHFEGPPFVPPDDDSRFPLSADDLEPNEGGRQLSFRGDGLSFILDVRGGPWDTLDLSTQQEEIVGHMIESIRFEPWDGGDARNGFLAPPGSYPMNGGDETRAYRAYFMGDEGWLILVLTGSTDRWEAFGPFTSCATAEPIGTRDAFTFHCDDGSEWSFRAEDGSTLSAGGTDLASREVITAWDGSLLVVDPS